MINNLISVLLFRMGRSYGNPQAAGVPTWVTVTIIFVVIGGIAVWLLLAGKKK